jgi:hypothetical protein
MIEKLLQRIARRGALPYSQLGAPDDFVVSTRGHMGSISRPFYPARHSDWASLSAHAAHAAPDPSVRPDWAQAVHAYVTARADGTLNIRLPKLAAGFGAVHSAVAAMLCVHRAHLPYGCVCITQAGTTLAVLHLPKLAVQVHTRAVVQEGVAVQWAACEATAWHNVADAAVQTMSIDQLLWLYGQAVAQAVQHLPAEVGQLRLQLRQFPLVDPQALEMRHLGLMHIFSTDVLLYHELCTLVPEQDLPYLCADLASLYCCGALALLPDDGAA